MAYHSAKEDTRWDNPIYHERPIRVICIGAGASGLLFAYKLQRSFRNFSLTVYDKNADVSGTWTENRYPGCACDVPSHSYAYTFFPNPNYTHSYSGSEEIRKYFQRFASTFGLHHYIKTKHEVQGATWDDAQDKWVVKVKDFESGETITDTGDFLINATGFLNNWKWPNVPGLDKFKGDLVHTAAWPEDLDLRGKRVGLIGNGSSGIQVLPAIQPEVRSLTTFIRHNTWITKPFGKDGPRAYSEEEMREFQNPDVLLGYRKEAEAVMHDMFAVFLRDHPVQQEARKIMAEEMDRRLNGDKELSTRLIPTWSVGCRRYTPGPGYLEALRAPNVHVVYGGVTEVLPNGCKTSTGETFELDTLICATGFDVSHRPRFPLVGRHGVNLQDAWAKSPHSYMSLGAPHMPNYIMLMGPNSPAGNGPVLQAIEAQVAYATRMIDHAAIADFNEYVDAFMEKTVWKDACKSWYKNGTTDGRVTGLWPGSALHFTEAIREPRWDDWDVTYKGNCFAWLGNGYSQTETTPGADLAWYLSNEDKTEWGSKWKRREEEILPNGRTQEGKSNTVEEEMEEGARRDSAAAVA
ncbi:FAD/NAD(P)-binding domain-containing protein [Phyllosticta citricarpa]|uniref:FAD/NAD(P)-binding domain-containing protein n=1 Tax=Phyllosticta citricarpa TaxID=55181 RepID=A0ABR1MGZ1_9PEZI